MVCWQSKTPREAGLCMGDDRTLWQARSSPIRIVLASKIRRAADVPALPGVGGEVHAWPQTVRAT